MDGDVRLVGDAGTIKIAFGTTDLATAKARWSEIHAQVELMKVELAVPGHTTLARRRRTFDVRNHRWRRIDRVDIVINSSGVKFFSDGEWVGSGDTHTLNAQDGHIPHHTHQRREAQLQCIRSPAERSRRSYQKRQPQHDACKSGVSPRRVTPQQSYSRLGSPPCTKAA
jgi:hypothetical protein